MNQRIKLPDTPLPSKGQVTEVSGEELKMLLSRLLTVAMMERVQCLRLHTKDGRMSFQINDDLWSPAMGKPVLR